ncbi:hypothetical protein ACVWZD_005661 [Streptomyces sp. TE3672]
MASRAAIGDSGTGKPHLLIALGTTAAMAGFRGRYALAAKLVNERVEAADEKQLTKTIARYGRVDLLCIDELGYMELDERGAELLFQVLAEREEKNSVAIASNESFSGWTKTFTDPRLCAATVDRLTFGVTPSRPEPAPTVSPAPAPSRRRRTQDDLRLHTDHPAVSRQPHYEWRDSRIRRLCRLIPATSTITSSSICKTLSG